MPIEFRCPHCDQRLQTPDGTQGRPTRCPACEQTIEVPWGPASVPDLPTNGVAPVRLSSPAPRDTDNPFQAPTTVSDPPAAVSTSPLRAQKVTIGEIVGLTWETLRNRLSDCLLFGLILVAIYFAGSLVNFIFSTLVAVGGNQQPLLIVVQNFVLFIWGQIFGAVICGIALRYALNILRGAAEPIQGAFQILPIIWRLILVQLIISLVPLIVVAAVTAVMLVPVMLLGVNGADPSVAMVTAMLIVMPLSFCLFFYIWARFSLAMPLVVDRRLGVTQSLSESLYYTRGNVIAIFGAFLVVSILATLFTLFTCLLGSILAFPAIMITMALTYLLVTGQPFETGATPYDSPGASPFAPTPDEAGD